MPVYFIKRDAPPEVVKIGFTRNLDNRLKAIRIASPDELTLIRTVDGFHKTERWFHKRFAHLKVRNDWFSYHHDMLHATPDIDPEDPSNNSTNIKYIKPIENRIKGAGKTIAAFCEENEISRGTWSAWKAGREPGILKWKRVLDAVEALEQ